MIYFDTDVWIHSLILQSSVKHNESRNIMNNIQENDYIISNLNIQEILFVLAKLKISSIQINEISEKLLQLNIQYYGDNELKRANLLAQKIGYQHINDCIHTAIAETYCTEITTYNKKDFNRIKKLTNLKVTIL